MGRTWCSLVVACAAALPVLAADGTVQVDQPLKKPRKTAPSQGGPLDRVEIKVWVPDHVKVLRGVVVNPFYLKHHENKHWQEACRLWRFALVGSNFASVAAEDYPALPAALKEAGDKTGHPELDSVPFFFVGMSAGAGMSMKFADRFPERTLAVGPVCLEVGPRSDATRRIPTLTVFGEKDGKQMALLAQRLPEQRRQGALFATAVQWGRRHEFGQANNLLLPFLDEVIESRLPPKDGKLQPLAVSSGWLGRTGTWNSGRAEIGPFAAWKEGREEMAWFPGPRTAHVWQAFVTPRPAVKIKSPPGLGDGQPFVAHPVGKAIAVHVLAPPDIESIELTDAGRPLAKASRAPFHLEVRGLAPGIHSLIAVGTGPGGVKSFSRPHTIVVQGE